MVNGSPSPPTHPCAARGCSRHWRSAAALRLAAYRQPFDPFRSSARHGVSRSAKPALREGLYYHSPLAVSMETLPITPSPYLSDWLGQIPEFNPLPAGEAVELTLAAPAAAPASGRGPQPHTSRRTSTINLSLVAFTFALLAHVARRALPPRALRGAPSRLAATRQLLPCCRRQGFIAGVLLLRPVAPFLSSALAPPAMRTTAAPSTCR